jgi:PAS domain-containing protein
MATETASTEALQPRIRLLEEQLRDSGERLRREHMFNSLLANLPDLICTFDLKGRFTYANGPLLGV